MKGDTRRATEKEEKVSRGAAAKIPRVEGAVADSVLVAQPGEIPLKAQPVTAVRRAPIPAVSPRR